MEFFTFQWFPFPFETPFVYVLTRISGHPSLAFYFQHMYLISLAALMICNDLVSLIVHRGCTISDRFPRILENRLIQKDKIRVPKNCFSEICGIYELPLIISIRYIFGRSNDYIGEEKSSACGTVKKKTFYEITCYIPLDGKF